VAVSKITWIPFTIAVVSCGLVGIAAGLHPARKAAGVDPVVALREKSI
jgi:ABC-type antimicrobial peptide transport system permease subunit